MEHHSHARMDDERQPLLINQPPSQSKHDLLQANKARRSILILICISIVAADFGFLLSYAPQIQILESLICERHRSGLLNQPAKSFCKSPQVQGELVLLTGWKDTFDQIPSIVLALPYGYAADRIGRKPVLLLSVTGLILEELTIRLIFWWNDVLPLHAIWFTPFFQTLGGGPQIATSMAYAMVTDIVPSSDRTTIFFLIGAAIIIGEILAPPLSALMVLWTPWFPMVAGLAFQVVALLSAAALPETAPRPDGVDTTRAVYDQNPTSADTGQRFGWERAKRWRQSWILLRKGGLLSTNVLCILGSFLLASVGRQALQLIVQYASKRFSWSIAGAGLVVTFKALVNLAALMFLLPQLSLVLSRHMSPAAKDRTIVRGSAWALTAGALTMAVSPNPALFIVGVGLLALGWGYYSAIRSLAAALVAPFEIGMLSTLIGLAQSAGTMAAGPALALAFKRGIELDGFWLGLPYVIAAALFLGTTCLNYGVRLQNSGNAVDEPDGEPNEQQN